LDLPVVAIAVLCRLLARRTLQTRHHRRLQVLHSLCSHSQRRTARHLGLARSTVERWHKNAEWVFIADQLNTHKPETLVRFVADRVGFEGKLGRKGRRGILKNPTSRKAFLANSKHRIRFVYTPKHCSWLNQVEIWFSILSRKALKRASFASLDELRERILQFVDYFNETMAKAFKWTYRGKALQA
jgi:transposase